MMKDLTGAGALLPLAIFGHPHDPEALLAPLRGLGIVQKYLPPLQVWHTWHPPHATWHPPHATWHPTHASWHPPHAT
jgi:hypothetical protein